MQFYTLKVAGLTRQLPLCPVSDKLDIAAFILHLGADPENPALRRADYR